jgi:hypothetical protein
MTVSEIGKVQALVLVQDIGLWSGNRRKMEIAECRKLHCRLSAVYMANANRLAHTDIGKLLTNTDALAAELTAPDDALQGQVWQGRLL